MKFQNKNKSLLSFVSNPFLNRNRKRTFATWTSIDPLNPRKSPYDIHLNSTSTRTKFSKITFGWIFKFGFNSFRSFINQLNFIWHAKPHSDPTPNSVNSGYMSDPRYNFQEFHMSCSLACVDRLARGVRISWQAALFFPFHSPSLGNAQMRSV